MKDAIGGILRSKKALACMTGCVCSVSARLGGGVFEDPLLAADLSEIILGITAAYVVGQGVADHGKHQGESK